MNALILTLFVSILLGTIGVLFFLYTQIQASADHNSRLSFAPLDDDDASPIPKETAPPNSESPEKL